MATARGVKAGEAFIKLGTENSALMRGLADAQRRLKTFGAAIATLGAGVAGLGTAGVAGMFKAAEAFSEAGDKIDKAAIRTGLSAEAVSELGFAAEQSGSNLEALEKGFRAFQKALADAAKGEPAAARALGEIGLSAESLMALHPDDQVYALADAIAAMKDPARRAEAAMTLLSESGAGLVPLLQDGSSGVRALRQEAERLGLTFSELDAKGAAALNDALNGVNRQLKALWQWIGSAVAPALTEMLRVASPIISGVIEWVKGNKELVASIAAWSGILAAAGFSVVALGVGIVFVGSVLAATSAIVTATVTAVSGLIAAASSATLWMAGLGAAAVLGFTDIRKHARAALDWLSEKLDSLLATGRRTVQGFADAIASGDIEAAARILWAALEQVWAEGTLALLDVWYEYSTAMMASLQELRTGALVIWADMTSSMDAAFWDMIHSSMDGLTKLEAKLKSWHTQVTGWVADQHMMAMADVDPEFDLEKARQIRRGNDAAQLERIGTEKDRELKERGEDFKNLDIEQGSRLEGEMAEIADAAKKAERSLIDAAEAGRKAAKDKLDAAKATLDKLIEEARLRRIMTEEGAKQLEISKDIATWSRVAGRAQASVGSFSALQVASYRPDDLKNPMERMAQHTSDLRTIASRIDNRLGNVLSFG